MEAVAEVRTDVGLIYGRLRHDLPVGTLLYSQATVDTLRAQLEAAEAEVAEARDALRIRTADYYAQGDAYDAMRARAEAAEARSGVELLEAFSAGRRAIGDHYAPDHCYATGPMTGDHFRDLVQCPACSFIAMHDAAMSRTKEETKS